ncbi:MAG: carbon storage regulator CsrA [Blastocatellia bacterium]
MLVLTRLIGEKLVIGNEVIIEVLAVNGDNVKLGISAPRETSVHRYEVFAEIQAANRAAAAAPLAQNLVESLASRLRAREETTEPTND